MMLLPVADTDFKGQFFIRDSETGLILCVDASFSFHIDDRLLSGNEWLADNLILEWNRLFDEGKSITP